MLTYSQMIPSFCSSFDPPP